ncbi:MAG: glycosyltransferase family 4 protein [Comamonadaceae bacterium]|nr:glycosyltransferase family 4 protein [Comamonadaceae bacterium]
MNLSSIEPDPSAPSNPLRVAAFTGGDNVPGARFRIRQHIPALRDLGVDLTEFAAPLGSYPPRSRLARPLWGVATLAARLPGIVRSHGFDVTWLQREMLSKYVTLEPLTRAPRVLDVDDAIWLNRPGRFAPRLARLCAGVICGNSYLAENFERWNPNIAIVPTAVDTRRFTPAPPSEELVIGWSGTSGGYEYFRPIETAFATVLQRFPQARLRIVSDRPPAFTRIAPERVEYIRWSPDNEVSAIQGMTVGIMPLLDSPWARGKCSFKMLTYMACGIPVVATPVGMNADVLAAGDCGLGARSVDDWVDALTTLLQDHSLARTYGRTGRQIIVERYSAEVVAPALKQALTRFAGR